MFERDIYHNYQLVCEGKKMDRGFKTFWCRGERYIVVPQRNLSYEDIQEQLYVSECLKHAGEKGIAELCPTVSSMPNAYIDGSAVMLFKLDSENRSPSRPLGEELADFHLRSKNIHHYHPLQRTAFGQWAELWMKRMDNMHKKYHDVKQRKEKNDFDRLFLTSFPYYEGLAENAIQYIVDHALERGPAGLGSSAVCHERFSEGAWVDVDGTFAKLPVGWIVDHPVRDLAEWIRGYVYQDNFRNNQVLGFIDDYEKVKPLSKSSWRLLYGRLLFPVHYFDLVEGHYENERDIGKELFVRNFNDVVGKEIQNEQFLRSFYRAIGLPVKELNIPIVDWLSTPY
ncbi:spore coat putative kinase YutH [Fictibacillus aquaticus]|uniref:spore coat putative kinase YutH n=1 Tax=Fictibacillus aquaticus TaxID=2021314 RepID=UPI0035E8C0B7